MRFLVAAFLCLFSVLKAESGSDFIVLPEQKVHEGDYFVSGGSIEISGIVNGDVYAFGSQIIIDGKVKGDVISSGGSVEISGEVEGNVRVAAGRILISGKIGRNLTALGGNVQLTQGSNVGGSAVFTGGLVDLSGSIQGGAMLSASNARLQGEIGKSLKAYVGQLHLGPTAKIKGNLEYSSSKEAQIDPGAQIGGKLTYRASAVGEFFEGEWKRKIALGSKLTGVLMNLFFTLVIGWIFIKLFSKKTIATVEMIRTHPWKSFWTGILVFILLPLACLILFITILGFPIAIALLAFSLLTFYAAKIFSVIWASNVIFPKIGMKKGSFLVFTFGLVVFFLLTQIPVFGGVLSFIATVVGLGAVVLSRVHRVRKASKKRAKRT